MRWSSLQVAVVASGTGLADLAEVVVVEKAERSAWRHRSLGGNAAEHAADGVQGFAFSCFATCDERETANAFGIVVACEAHAIFFRH